jgi:predicted transcriptional regulator
MPLISIRLSDEIEARLAREAERLRSPKSEIARDAIVDYLKRLETQRFLDDIALAARARGTHEALSIAEEALVLDNEALEATDPLGVQEPKAKYRVRKRKR